MHITTDNKMYPVTSGEPTLAGFYETMFGGLQKPLCDIVQANGCEHAVAATSWSFDMDKELYAPDGFRKRIGARSHIRIILPEWQNPSTSKDTGKEAVHRFQSATKTHERGHAAACKSLMTVLTKLVQAMPERVNPDLVSDLNAGFRELVTGFYVQRARKADKHFDIYSGHGGKLEAELDSVTSEQRARRQTVDHVKEISLRDVMEEARTQYEPVEGMTSILDFDTY